jgi:hypothetical protein
MVVSAVRTPTVSVTSVLFESVSFNKLSVFAFAIGVVVSAGGCAAAPTPQPRVVAVSKSPSLLQPNVALPAAPSLPMEDEMGEGLTAAQVAAVVETRSLAVGGCHVVEYSGRPPEAGFVVVDLDIERDGAVSNAAVSESSFEQGDLPLCVASVASGLTFPKASHATQVSWRFDFKGR